MASIDRLEVATYRIPTDGPEGDGTLNWQTTELLVVHLYAGQECGLGYSYTAAQAAAYLTKGPLWACLSGANPMDLPALWERLNQSLRNAGRPGLGMMAIAAIDQALWDLKAKTLGLSLCHLWGMTREPVPVYGSGGFTTYSDERLAEQLTSWVREGITAVKMKLGLGLEADERRVGRARQAIGQEAALLTDANGAYDRHTALALTEQLAPHKVCWLEEPVSSDDLDGLRWLRDRAPAAMAIAAGEYGWDNRYFHRMLAAGAVDVLQADATRCGYTGFLQAAQLCDVYQIPLSAHCAPAIHTPVCAAVPRLLHLEYFHDHVRIERLFFDHKVTLRDGALWPDLESPGHGLTLNQNAARPYQMDAFSRSSGQR